MSDEKKEQEKQREIIQEAEKHWHRGRIALSIQILTKALGINVKQAHQYGKKHFSKPLA